MRMGDSYGVDSAERLDQRNRVRIDQAHTVPQNVSFFRSYKQRPLAYPEVGYGGDAPNPLPFLKQPIAMRPPQLLQSDPLLPLQTDELAFILADGTARRWVVGGRKLCSTGHTQMASDALWHLRRQGVSQVVYRSRHERFEQRFERSTQVQFFALLLKQRARITRLL